MDEEGDGGGGAACPAAQLVTLHGTSPLLCTYLTSCHPPSHFLPCRAARPPASRAGKATCAACNASRVPLSVSRHDTLAEVLERLKADPALQLSNPSVRSEGRNLYMANPLALREATA